MRLFYSTLGLFVASALVYLLALNHAPGDVVRVLLAAAAGSLVAMVVALVRWCVLDVRSDDRALTR